MRCYGCNTRLTPKEACTKFKLSGTFTELCNKCLKDMDVEVVPPRREFSTEGSEVGDEYEN